MLCARGKSTLLLLPALQTHPLYFWSLCILLFIICPNCAGMQLFSAPYSFFVFCCLRRCLCRCNHCSKRPQTQPCLITTPSHIKPTPFTAMKTTSTARRWVLWKQKLGLSCSWPLLQYLTQCLTHRWYPVNICQVSNLINPSGGTLGSEVVLSLQVSRGKTQRPGAKEAWAGKLNGSHRAPTLEKLFVCHDQHGHSNGESQSDRKCIRWNHPAHKPPVAPIVSKTRRGVDTEVSRCGPCPKWTSGLWEHRQSWGPAWSVPWHR